jgi:hypothetical protein
VTDSMSLTQAAVALQKSYNVVLRLVLLGRIRGEQRNGRWFVDARDVARLKTGRVKHRPSADRD